MGKERDDKDAVLDIARDLAEIASQIAQLKSDARAYLSDPSYNTLKHRLENAHSAVEAAALKPGRGCGSTREDSPGPTPTSVPGSDLLPAVYRVLTTASQNA